MRETNDTLTRQLQAFAPDSILAVGDGAAALVSEYCSRHPGCELVLAETEKTVASLVTASPRRRFDFGVIAGYLESADKETGDALMARLRDVLVRRLCVLISGSGRSPHTGWSDSEMAALGFSLIELRNTEAGGGRMYGFDISSYKRTPDWLNPRHWAHPERWNKDRW